MSEHAFPIPPAWAVPPLLAARNALAYAHSAMAPPEFRIMERLTAMVEGKALLVVVELRVADALDDDALAIDDLAAEVGAHADALDRFLRLLVSIGFFTRDRDGRYRNNIASHLLRADHPGSMRDWCRFWSGDWHWEMWNHATDAVRSGTPAAEHAWGRGFFEYVNTHPEAGSAFNGAMAQTSRLQAPLIATGYPWDSCRRVCDVGGGTGTLLAEVLARHPSLQGVLYDRPDVVANAAPVLEAAGVADRCEVVGGDFFTSVPEGCDAYVLQSILHDWGDEPAAAILRIVRQAMPPGSRVLAVEFLLPDDDRRTIVRLFDLQMLVSTSGRERTRQQWQSLFARAGLVLDRVIPLPTTNAVLEARRGPGS